MMTIEDFGRALIKKAEPYVDDIDLIVARGNSLTYEIENKNVAPKLETGKTGISIRVLKDNKIGYSSITNLNVEEGLLAVKKAATDTKKTEISDFADIEYKGRKIKLYDPQVAELYYSDPGFLKEIAEAIVERTYNCDKNLENLQGSVGIGIGEKLICSKKGQVKAYELSRVEMDINVNHSDFDYYSLRKLPDNWEDIKSIGANLYANIPKEKASPDKLGVSKGKTIDVIFEPACVESVIRALVSNKIYGSSKQNGLSNFSVGELIAGENFTLVDDGTADWMHTSYIIDDEGTQSQKNTVIDKGVLETFLYDRASAYKDGQEPTGNGIGRPVSENFRGLYLEPSRKPLEKIIGEIDKGIQINYLLGLHTADTARASFICGVHGGKTIERGQYKDQLEPGTWNVSGALFDLDEEPGILKDIELSKETKNTGTAVMPWMKVKLKI
ncbi:MAG: TldD/PmbA family protein [Candidatus Aenigmarchaeota archaeon]|nr:TldD/PmbA family protein [Candidatus Aenigmarchaeota archaeon]